ncbi:hypothetical protein [Methanobrevibacter sp.]|uniref:hypothetical protein n=1 Tax=Methanobrevibacter sp. TaxID=66852 RepID=UPI0026323542|nr:hypothetical protein [uncultured Methanobrevibacter sp.]
MKVGKFTSVVLSVIFFLDIIIIFAWFNTEFFPNFSFSNNEILRIILLIIVLLITKTFYSYLRNLKGGKNQNDIEESDLTKKILMTFTIGFFISIFGIFIIMNM